MHPYFCIMPESKQPKLLPQTRWIQHVLFWIGIYFFDVWVFGWDTQKYGLFFRMVLYEMPGQMILAYVMMYICLPLYMKRHYAEAAAVFILAFFICAFTAHALIYYGSDYYDREVSLFSISKLVVRGFYLFANAAIATIIKLARGWYEMQNVKLESELKMLKDQVNPHFMFNTLNNLYGLIEKNPRHAQDMILGLSRILHYMLHESNHPAVSLRKEMGCVRDYIELEKIRYAGNLSVSINQQPETESLSIVPLVIFPFVENSFKHGASETIDVAWINMDCSVYKGEFVFKIENARSDAKTREARSGGIGLYNVRRRLELIYGTDHSLQIIDGHDTFLVVLKIKLRRMNEAQVPHH